MTRATDTMRSYNYITQGLPMTAAEQLMQQTQARLATTCGIRTSRD